MFLGTWSFVNYLQQYYCSNTAAPDINRVTLNTATLLDICIMNTLSDNVESGRLCSGLSDHFPISCFLCYEDKSTQHKDTYMYWNIYELSESVQSFDLQNNVE